MEILKTFGHGEDEVSVFSDGSIASTAVKYTGMEHEQILEIAYDLYYKDRMWAIAENLRNAVRWCKTQVFVPTDVIDYGLGYYA